MCMGRLHDKVVYIRTARRRILGLTMPESVAGAVCVRA